MTVLSVIFALWILLSVFLALAYFGITVHGVLLSIGFVVLFSVLRSALPYAVSKIPSGFLSSNYKFKTQKYSIDIRDEDGNADYSVNSKLINLGKEPRQERKHDIWLFDGQLDEEEGLEVIGQGDTPLECDFLNRKDDHWEFRVHFSRPIPRLGSYSYKYSLRLKDLFSKEDKHHSWTWKPRTAIDQLEIEVSYGPDIRISNARMIDVDTGQVLGGLDPRTRSIVGTFNDLGPGEYKLEWTTVES